MKFHYVATNQAGRVVEGNAEAETSAEVLSFLAAKDLKPISIARAKEKGLGKRRIYLGKAIDETDKIFLTKHLALMLSLGTDLFRALDILIADTNKPALKTFLGEVRETLEKGQPFYVTFERYPKYFSPVFTNLVKAGESSGTLGQTFNDLSVTLAKNEDVRRKIRAALIYPAILLVGSFLILIFLVTFALPRIAEVFSQGNLNIPVFSRIVFGVGLFFANYIWYLVILFLILVISIFVFVTRFQAGKNMLAGFLNKIPVVSGVIKKIAIQRFSGTLSSLIKAGVPIIQSLEITAVSVGQRDLHDALLRVARQGVARGLTLGDAFKREPAFPLSVQTLIAVSEKAGHLDEVLETLSTFYESEIESSIKTMVSFIEPVLLIIIGGFVGLIALSIVVPVYQLIGQF